MKRRDSEWRRREGIVRARVRQDLNTLNTLTSMQRSVIGAEVTPSRRAKRNLKRKLRRIKR